MATLTRDFENERGSARWANPNGDIAACGHASPPPREMRTYEHSNDG
jgi:hypothetical protein